MRMISMQSASRRHTVLLQSMVYLRVWIGVYRVIMDRRNRRSAFFFAYSVLWSPPLQFTDSWQLADNER